MRLIFRLAFFVCPFAASAAEQDAIRRAVDAGQIRPLGEILVQVQATHAGRVTDVELERALDDGRLLYEIELLGDDGRRREIDVDAATGAVLQREAPAVGVRPLAELLRTVSARYPGQMLDVELERGLYRVEIVRDDGVHLQIVLDPRDGTAAEDPRSALTPDILPMSDILERVADSYPGTVIEAELERGNEGVPYYELDLQDAQDRVLELRIDARTGALLREEDI